MTPEELMKPRYKTIADFPSNILPIGHITTLNGTATAVTSSVYFFEKYRHLFQKLEWWEERKVEDMPVYVKTIPSFESKPRIIKVQEWFLYDTLDGAGNPLEMFGIKDGYSHGAFALLPATETEYLKYLETQKQPT